MGCVRRKTYYTCQNKKAIALNHAFISSRSWDISLKEYFITDDGGHLDFQDGRIGMTLKPSVTIYGPPPLLQLDNSTIESNLYELWRK